MKKAFYSYFIIGLTLLVLSCSQRNTPNQPEKINGKAGIYFENKEHDFGDVEYNGDATYDFAFKNIGDEPLLITNVRTSCGCTVPYYSKQPFPQDSTGVISIEFDTKLVGRFNKSIYVYTNAMEEAIELKIKGHIGEKPEENQPNE